MRPVPRSVIYKFYSRHIDVILITDKLAHIVQYHMLNNIMRFNYIYTTERDAFSLMHIHRKRHLFIWKAIRGICELRNIQLFCVYHGNRWMDCKWKTIFCIYFNEVWTIDQADKMNFKHRICSTKQAIWYQRKDYTLFFYFNYEYKATGCPQ